MRQQSIIYSHSRRMNVTLSKNVLYRTKSHYFRCVLKCLSAFFSILITKPVGSLLPLVTLTSEEESTYFQKAQCPLLDCHFAGQTHPWLWAILQAWQWIHLSSNLSVELYWTFLYSKEIYFLNVLEQICSRYSKQLIQIFYQLLYCISILIMCFTQTTIRRRFEPVLCCWHWILFLTILQLNKRKVNAAS